MKKKNNDRVFGYQLLLDFYDCVPEVCDDIELCYDFLDKIVDDLGMKKQSPPSIFRSDAKLFPDKAGLSGWVPLIESSVVIHTLVPKNFVSIDIYSCRSFDKKRAEEFCKKYFMPKKIDHQFLERGKDYYKIHTKHHTLTVHKGKVKLTMKNKVK